MTEVSLFCRQDNMQKAVENWKNEAQKLGLLLEFEETGDKLWSRLCEGECTVVCELDDLRIELDCSAEMLSEEEREDRDLDSDAECALYLEVESESMERLMFVALQAVFRESDGALDYFDSCLLRGKAAHDFVKDRVTRLERREQRDREWQSRRREIKSDGEQESKFSDIRKKETNGLNYDIDTNEVFDRIVDLDNRFGLNISEVENDRVTLHFNTLPEEVEELADELIGWCPDLLSNFEAIPTMVEVRQEQGKEVPEHIKQLTEGVNLDHPDAAHQILTRTIKKEKNVTLWWD